MRFSAPRSWAVLGLVLATQAPAHIKLLSPPEWVATSAAGDPQKTGPCGAIPGDALSTFTDAGVTVVAGSTLTVQWAETVLHPGHFRLAITADRALLLDPAVTLTAGGLCDTAAIQSPPVPPVVADGVLPHLTASIDGGLWQATIRVPATPCERCTLQLVQFMSVHGPPCFYYHCAWVRIVAAPDAGTTSDAGAPSDAGTPSDAGSVADAGAAADGGELADAGPGGQDDAGTTPDGGQELGPPGQGCGCQGGGPALLAPLLLAAAWRRRRTG